MSHYSGFSDQQLISTNLPLAAAGFEPRSAAAHAVVARGRRTVPDAGVRCAALAGKWIIFYGDSANRQVLGGLLCSTR